MGKAITERFYDEPWIEWMGTATSTPPPYNHAYATGTQNLIESDNHAPLTHLGHSDEGGPFHVLRHVFEERKFGPTHNRTVVSPGSDGNGFAYNYKGCYHAYRQSITDSTFPVPAQLTPSELTVYGTTAIRRCLPTNPLVDLANILGELRSEGLPLAAGSSFIRDEAIRFRGIGEEYLNKEFGWDPFIRDLQSLSNAIWESEEKLKWYIENSGKLIRRKYQFQPTFSSSTTVDSSGNNAWPFPQLKTGYWNAGGALTITTTTRQKIWFSGAFTYHLPSNIGSLKGKMQLLDKKLGGRITPETIYNLTPWTWAIDWVTNLGDVLHNLVAFSQDGLVMPYAYIMCQSTKQTYYSHSGARTRRFNEPVNVWQRFESTRKQRAGATPYGFGLNPSGFSNRQWSILTALGLAKGGGQL